MSPRKQNRDLLCYWKSRRRERRMLDKALIHGFYEPKLVYAHRFFHHFIVGKPTLLQKKAELFSFNECEGKKITL